MNKVLLFGLTILTGVGLAVTANAISLTSVGGIYTGANGGSRVNGIGTSEIFWGNPAYYNQQSGLGFTGNSPQSLNPDEVFSLGSITHYNKPIYSGSSASSVDFDLSLTFADSAEGDYTSSFRFFIDETPNYVTPYEDPRNDDFVTFSNVSSNSIFHIAGVEYTFSLLGFGESADNLSSSFRSSERGSNSIQLWGKLTTNAAPVPEPSTTLLFGLGVAGFVGVTRRKKTKNSLSL
ncbi:THxN family PEP-CTERM protein [Desulfogranum mediterraneum]|uniref:THxN family PEP-CTERM protein n=1 Tax=Desulfogranum mediterraneum TaxID=160661 RepID=UPI00041D0ED6|nr:THxN family PEP-CTERM protein [Desulfogranum mediterraneum]